MARARRAGRIGRGTRWDGPMFGHGTDQRNRGRRRKPRDGPCVVYASPTRGAEVIASLLRLLALRPLLGMAVLGVPVIALIAIGLVTVFAVKAVLALLVPALIVIAVIWLIRRSRRS
jgi:hypothetical protein